MKFLAPPLDEMTVQQLKSSAPGVEIITAHGNEDALKKVVDADASFTFISPQMIKTAQKLRWVQVGSAGVEGCLFPELVESDIVLTNAKGIFGIQMAEHAMALILSLSRAINILIRRQMDEVWESRANLPATEIYERTLGIIGLGGIGLDIAKRAQAFGMRIIAVDPTQTQKPQYVEHLWRPERLHDMLRESDFVMISCALTPQTRKMMNAQEFKVMKPSAHLINIARGGIVDQDALIAALRAKEIAGAGLDVTDPEPLPKGNELWQMENVVITPHNAGQSPYSGDRLMRVVCENLRRFATGEQLINVVDKRVGY